MTATRLLTLTLALTLAGCTGVKAPTVSVVDAAIVETNEDAIAASFTLDLANPNSAPLRLREIEYTGTLNGATFHGRRAAEVTLPASGDDRITVPAAFRLDAMAAGATSELQYSIRGTVVYVAPQRLAEILLDTSIYRPKAPFAGTGALVAP